MIRRDLGLEKLSIVAVGGRSLEQHAEDRDHIDKKLKGHAEVYALPGGSGTRCTEPTSPACLLDELS